MKANSYLTLVKSRKLRRQTEAVKEVDSILVFVAVAGALTHLGVGGAPPFLFSSAVMVYGVNSGWLSDA